MAVDYQQCTFQYDGKFYIFGAFVVHDGEEYPLDNNAVGMFQYKGQMDSLVYRGSLEYTDNFGKFDSIFKGGRTICRVMLYQGQTENDVIAAAQKNVVDKRLQLDFMVDSVEILSRAEQTIKYKLNLVAAVMEKCLINVRYSNFNSGPEPCLEIFKKCAEECQLAVDQTQFKKLGSDIKIAYAVGVNDNLISVKRYLFDKMYSYGEAERSMKFIYYDFGANMYRLFDVARPAMSTIGIREINISQQQNGMESLFQSDGIDIGAPANFSQMNQVVAFRSKRIWKYDLTSNSFVQAENSVEQINNIYNSAPDNVQAEIKLFKPVFVDKTADYNSNWSNYADIYEQLSDCFFNGKSIRIEVSGDIFCRTGYAVKIIMNNLQDILFDDPPQKFKDERLRYQGFNGIWYVQSVHGYFSMQDQEFKQVLTLIRSYIVN